MCLKTSCDFIAHHGILGQKWGIRRFQNKDGSYTEEGKKRYSSGKVRETISNALLVAAGAGWLSSIAGVAICNMPLSAVGVGTFMGSTIAATLIAPKSISSNTVSSNTVSNGQRFMQQEQIRQFAQQSLNESQRACIDGMRFAEASAMTSMNFTMNHF